MEENRNNNRDEVYSRRIKAGKRTYFIDVKETRGNDFYITITESKRKFGEQGYSKHKIFLYKEDFNKFVGGLLEVVEHVKTNLNPDYDYEKFSHDGEDFDHEHDIFDEFGDLETVEEPKEEKVEPEF